VINHLALRSGNLVIVDIKIKHKQLCFFGAVPAADGTYKFTVAAADAPHNATTPSAFQRNEVPQEFTGPQVPYLDGAIVRRRDDEASIELETRDSTLMFVGTYVGTLTILSRHQSSSAIIRPCLS